MDMFHGLMSWGTTCQTKLIKLKISKNDCLRGIFFANKRESQKPYFALLENIFKLKVGSFVNKIQYQQKQTPPALYDLAQPTSAVDERLACNAGVFLERER